MGRLGQKKGDHLLDQSQEAGHLTAGLLADQRQTVPLLSSSPQNRPSQDPESGWELGQAPSRG